MYRQGSQVTDPNGVSWERKHNRFLTFGTIVVGLDGAYIWPKPTGILKMVGPAGIEFSHQTGSGLVVMQTSPTIITPTIANFTNAQHNHQDAAGGGLLTAESQGGIAAFPIEGLGDLTWDLVHSWALEEASGTRVAAVGGQDLSDINTVLATTDTPFASSVRAATFVAANSEALFLDASPTTLRLINGTPSTWACWFRTTTIAAGDAQLMCTSDDANSVNLVGLRRSGSTLFFSAKDSGGTARNASSGTTTIIANTWYPCRGWYDPSLQEIGCQLGSASNSRGPGNSVSGWGGGLLNSGAPFVPAGSARFALGRRGAVGADFFNGDIDSPCVWNRLLTDEEWDQWVKGREGALTTWRYGDVMSGAKTVLAAKLVLDMGTTGSDASNLYTIEVAKNATTTLFTKTTNGAEITADTVYDLGAPVVSTLADGDYLSMRVTKTGSPSDLRHARGRLVVHYEAA